MARGVPVWCTGICVGWMDKSGEGQHSAQCSSLLHPCTYSTEMRKEEKNAENSLTILIHGQKYSIPKAKTKSR